MTGMERIGAALQGRFADRRAAAPLLSLYGARLAGIPLERYYRDPRAYAAGQRAAVERFGPDAVFGPFALPLEAEAYGVELAWTDRAPPNARKPAAHPFPPGPASPERDPRLSYLTESVRLCAEACRGGLPVAAVLTAPVDLPALILGIDAWLELLLFDAAAAEAWFSFAEEHFAALAGAYASAGAAFAAVPVMFANPAIMTDTLIERLTLPALRSAFARSPLPIVFHHGATKLADRIGLFKGLPQVAGFVIDERDDSGKARAVLGEGPLLIAGPLGPTLQGRSPESAARSVRRFLDERADDPRFMVSTSAADIPYDTDEAVVDAIMRAAAGRETDDD